MQSIAFNNGTASEFCIHHGRPALHQHEVKIARGRGNAPIRPDVPHSGKFRALWAWLRDQPGAELPVTFDEIEEVIGTHLPHSCRKHPAH